MSARCDALIVDDCEADRYLLKRLLRKAGWFDGIAEARHGQEALEQLEAHGRAAAAQPVGARRLLVFLDVNMPGLTGFDVLDACEWCKSRGQIVVILFTSSDDAGDLARARCYACVAGRVVKMPEQVAELREQLAASVPTGWLPALAADEA